MIAVFINAILLIVLFMTAIIPEDGVDPDFYVTKQNENLLEIAHHPVLEKQEEARKKAREALFEHRPSATEEEPIKVAQASHRRVIHPLPSRKKEEPKRASYQEIVIQRGDTLEKLAQKYGVSLATIVEFNHLQSQVLLENQCLKIPTDKGPAIAKAKVDTKDAQSSSQDHLGTYYTVKVGDNPWTIAMKHRLKLKDLLELNRLDEKTARKLKPGDRLRIE